jgi:hypothetical protein
MEAQLSALNNVVNGVKVARTTTNSGDTYAWSITFMDPGDDFTLTVGSTTLSNSGSGTSSVGVSQAVDGKTFAACDGSVTINGLTQGTPYYVRVSAANEIGFGMPVTVTTTEKPMVVSGAPTAVSVSLVSSTSLRVFFSPPTDDGGDSVTEYLVEADPAATFNSAATTNTTVNGVVVTSFYHNQFKYLAGGAPFHHTITGLTKGTAYYLRVRAYNSRGYSVAQASSPAFDTPREIPSAPTNVQLESTSPTMLTVGWDDVLDNGGEAITQYKVEWDLTSTFTSLNVAPNKGEAIISDPTQRYYTIDSLSAGSTYYVRIFAANSVGYGTSVRPTPSSAVPAKILPGKPTAITVAATSSAGEISVAWSAPVVPYHNLFCAGTSSTPAACPATMGRGSEADGGSVIGSYLVEWDNVETFTSSSSNKGQTYVSVTGTGPYSHTITGLSNVEDIYIRVFAINAMGTGLACTQQADGTTTLCSGEPLSARAI